ncbi:MAG TPA: hypothetical protein VKG67_04830 [Gallionellaceae bacterium]|nr:hypothetical protein [Gallionellaceae bacterium]
MENRTARLTLLIDPSKKQIFEEICSSHDLTPSQVVRQMIRDYVKQYGTPDQIARMPLTAKTIGQ